jgi:preprotein translocase subunit SecG
VSLFITIVHILTCLLLVAVVLLQHGRGADVGAAFGSGASQTVFGASGAGNFLTRLTTGAAIVFMLTSLALSYFATPRPMSELLEEEAATETFLEPAVEPEVEDPEAAFAETVPIEGDQPGEERTGFETAPPAEPPSEGQPPAEPQ